VIDECLVVEFAVTGDGCPLAAASAVTDGTIRARPPQLRTDGNALLRFSAPASSEVGAVLDADDRVRYLHRALADGTAEYRCLSKERCVVHELTDEGFLVDHLRYDDGTEHHVGAVVGYDVLEGVLAAAGDRVGVEVERLYPLGSEGETTVARQWDLTPAQEAAVRAGLREGYFAVPREATAGAVAETLGISKSAFLERVRRAEARLFGQVFDDGPS